MGEFSPTPPTATKIKQNKKRFCFILLAQKTNIGAKTPIFFISFMLGIYCIDKYHKPKHKTDGNKPI